MALEDVLTVASDLAFGLRALRSQSSLRLSLGHPALTPAGACSGPNGSRPFVEPGEVVRIILILTLRAKH